jgi:hypothetical protein
MKKYTITRRDWIIGASYVGLGMIISVEFSSQAISMCNTINMIVDS